MSSLFDKELARHQQTNYETPKSAATQDDQKASAIDKIKDLARRQDELLQRQQELARSRDQMNADEMKRQLESLTREQNELRQRAEELAQQLARASSGRRKQINGPAAESTKRTAVRAAESIGPAAALAVGTTERRRSAESARSAGAIRATTGTIRTARPAGSVGPERRAISSIWRSERERNARRV